MLTSEQTVYSGIYVLLMTTEVPGETMCRRFVLNLNGSQSNRQSRLALEDRRITCPLKQKLKKKKKKRTGDDDFSGPLVFAVTMNHLP